MSCIKNNRDWDQIRAMDSDSSAIVELFLKVSIYLLTADSDG